MFMETRDILLRASERSERSEHIVVVSSRFYYIYNWRASEASETLFSHVYGNSRYNIYIYICTSVSNTHACVSVLRIKFKS